MAEVKKMFNELTPAQKYSFNAAADNILRLLVSSYTMNRMEQTATQKKAETNNAAQREAAAARQ